jgi:hypothetical protein
MANTFPQAPLFHYTSLAEFQQVLESKSIWLTANDSQTELNDTLSFIQQAIVTAFPGLSEGFFNIDAVASYPVYSFLLSSQSDLASEWQKYYPDGGFSIAIEQGQLSATMGACNLSLYQCIYDDSEKTDFVINTIVGISTSDYADSIAQAAPTCVLDPRQEMFAKEIKLINRNILNYAGLLKDGSLSEEQEWRIIASYSWSNILGGPADIPPDPLSLEIKSAVENDITITYLEAPLVPDPSTEVNISEVVIGPHPDMAQAKATCQSLLNESENPGSVVIIESAIPYS